jgi:alpha-beta hydrolase superfamily lysophospholipase
MSFGAFNRGFEQDGYHSAWVCSDREVLDAYHNDPLCQYVFTANGFYNLLSLMQACYAKKGWVLSKPELPIWFISGADDPCRTSNKAFNQSVVAMRKLGYKYVSSKTYPDMRHEILNETEKQVVWDDVVKMINEMIKKDYGN